MRFIYSRAVLFLVALALVAAFLGEDRVIWGN
jgi:hypothetical protein